MSEHINNREYRQKILKELILELHDGKSVDEVKDRFAKLIEGVSATEISMMENQLIKEGMPVEEVQRLCDVHAAVFKGSIEEIHQPEIHETPGHPIHTFLMENKAISRLIEKSIKPNIQNFQESDYEENKNKLKESFQLLWEIDKHYLRKENLLFPYMERYGITAPPKVMWGVDDEIRADIKEVLKLLSHDSIDKDELVEKAYAAIDRVEEMIFKEENILIPMVVDTLNEDEWLKIAKESSEIGFTLYEPKKEWKPTRVDVKEKAKKKEKAKNEGEKPAGDGYINFETGILSKEELEGLLNTLPVDITFVDKDGVVKFFSQGKERIFPRTKAVIGRLVQNCHPPASVHVVEDIVKDLRSGKKDSEEFYIRKGNQYIHIRYFAVRNKNGEYIGTLEFTQDIATIQEIQGEKRLVSD